MPLVRIPEPFDRPDWLFELKHDGFRALAHVEGHRCELVSRRGHVFKRWDVLCTEISHSIRAHDAVVDGQIVCLNADGRSNFHKLLFRRDWPYFYAFDLLSVDGEDLREWPLTERKRQLRSVMPRVDSRLLFVDSLNTRGTALYREVCRRDLEDIVAKWRHGRYETDGISTSWLKIKNPNYSQMVGRHELFERRQPARRIRSRGAVPVLALRA
jgi:bifunctional non-homologous end joining protein LigD